MRPAVDLGDTPVGVQVVVDHVRIGDEVPLVACEHVVHRVAVVPTRVLEQHVTAGRDEHEEVPGATLVLGLYQDPGRVGA